MNTTILIIIIGVIALFLIAVFFFLIKFLKKSLQGTIEKTVKMTEEGFKNERERLIEQFDAKKELMDEKLKNEGREMEQRKDSIKELVERIQKEMNEGQKKLTETEKERIGEFSSLKTVLEEYKTITGGLKESTDNLKNLLSNNQLRGKYGEEVAENLLKSAGFVKGQNYSVNVSQDTNANRPDFTIFLPDKTKINIDAKFPLQSLLKFQESKEKIDQDRYLKSFEQDVKQKIKQVTTRDYINPEENTVDFVILFVPNEMIFSFIYDQLNEVWNDAMKKKVILAGPFSFTAILRMIHQSYKNFKYQENLYEIIKLIKMFEQEYDKYNNELDKLGSKLQSASNQYNLVSVTRTKKLSGIVDKIKGENKLDEVEEIKILERKND